jgi:wyosine [tRNA(Phe)-imidazoG37] synthetase (radical SAM superfamily)
MFFFIVSFLLHLISIFAIVVLYQRRSLERVSLPSSQDDVETIHESIESFVDELEKENEALYEKLLQHIRKKESEWDGRLQLIEERLIALEIPAEVERESMEEEQISKEVKQKSKAVEQESEQESREEEKKQTDSLQNENKDPKFQQALELFNQGFSADQIAKVLQIGKGEAGLIVNMIKKYREG